MCGICALSAMNPVLMLCIRFLSLELAICLFKCLSIGKRFGFGGLKETTKRSCIKLKQIYAVFLINTEQ